MYTLNNFEIIDYRDFRNTLLTFETKGFVVAGRSNLPPVKLDLPFDWGADPHKDRNWMFQVHAWRPMDVYLNAVFKDYQNHKEYLEFILKVVDDWINYNIKGKGCDFTWYDMSTGLRALKIALLVKICEQYGLPFNRGHNQNIDTLIEHHLKHLTSPDELCPGNHGLFQLNGLMAMIWAMPDINGYHEYKKYAKDNMNALIAGQFGKFGVHTEHSPKYHFFALKTVKRLLSAPWWHLETFDDASILLEKAEIAKYWLVSPNKCDVPVGASTALMQVKDFSGLYKWPHLRNGDTIGAELDGYGVVRTDDTIDEALSSFLFYQASFNSDFHKHADCLSFVWQENNEYLLIDSGSYGYQRDRMQKYFLSTRAHNTIEIDNKSYNRATSDAYGSGLREVKPFGRGWKLTASVIHKPFDIKHDRTIIFMPGKLALVIDSMNAGRIKSKSFTSWWHINPNMIVSMTDKSHFQVTGLKHGRIIHGSFCFNHSKIQPVVTLARGIEEPEPLGWSSTGYLKYEPTSSLGFTIISSGLVLLATLFEIGESDTKGHCCLKCIGNDVFLEMHNMHKDIEMPADLILSEGCSVHFLSSPAGLTVN
jgi:hypothetical protein